MLMGFYNRLYVLYETEICIIFNTYNELWCIVSSKKISAFVALKYVAQLSYSETDTEFGTDIPQYEDQYTGLEKF
jgi:hypothetical protein